MAETKRAFVIGHPISHSRSPLVHGMWLQHHALEGTYIAHDVSPENLLAFFNRIRAGEFVGGNITLPHKETALELVDEVDDTARRLGAINTVWMEGDRLLGTNTDGEGFLANLDDRHPGWDAPARLRAGALVLGAGGASRAIVMGLADRGFQRVTVANRTVARGEAIAEEFGGPCDTISIDEASKGGDYGLIVNTTSLGMGGEGMPIDPALFPRSTLVTDAVYTPLMTPLLLAAKAAGQPTVDGLGMLLYQAVPGFERWFGIRPTVTNRIRETVLATMK
ncbi:shikimate dehydrogenase [Ahrensia sp. R2A130]|uniref:shikimate dehydrogenase n=1 Tax=Ahrensia sp. R2A130 TaxID=744979 RepID=UPI0001E0AC98|nr:shikimate dehydrogenase [Ahrensia sp. R2A130]EFL89705.1 shikimate 5-dehydrogenase [Ahrensia sp. R2A130]